MVVFVVLGVVVVFVIAAVVIGRETGRLAAQSPRPVFDVDEAVVWIADGLPFEVSARLAHADVRQMLLWSIEHLRLAGPTEGVVEDDTLVFVVDRAVEAGLDWTTSDVRAVLDARTAYLELIGAAAAQDERPPDV